MKEGMKKSKGASMTYAWARRIYRKLKRYWLRKTNSKLSTEEVFTKIYAEKKWGGESEEYCSGGGSTDEKVVNTYIRSVSNSVEDNNWGTWTAVDLGCGDMRVGLEVAKMFRKYIAVDIVKDVIDFHTNKNRCDNIEYRNLNIVEDDLPDGDICFVRQVLQHLSNDQISKIIDKLAKYKVVIITEHLPNLNPNIIYNKDKSHGEDLRIYDNSGVYLQKPPFNLPDDKIEKLCECVSAQFDGYDDCWMPGVIVTYVYHGL